MDLFYSPSTHAVLYSTSDHSISSSQRPLRRDDLILWLFTAFGFLAALLAAAGLLIGFAASLALNQLTQSLLFAVSATDPLVYLLMATLVIAIALIASSLPAVRATKIDPMQTLRSD